MNSRTLQEKARPAKMLLVEDNRGDVLLMQRAFAKSGVPYEFTVARSGEEALTMLYADDAPCECDMILLDLNLPGMSGHEVLRKLKGDERFKQIPIFVLSSSRAEEDVITSYEDHANCYLVKPHSIDDLYEIARRIGQFWYSIVVLPNDEERRHIA